MLSAFVLIGMSSCVSNDVRELRKKLASDYDSEAFSATLSHVDISQYIDAEKGLNKCYVNELETLLDGSFDKQIDEFERRELGFFKSYKYMLQTIFLSREKNEDIWRVKSSQYFSTIEVQQDALACYDNYVKMLGEYRTRFVSEANPGKAISAPVLSLPEQDICLDALQNHSRTNLIIEFGVDIAVWLLILLIIAVLGILGVAWTGGYSLVAFVLSLIISIGLSMINDHKMVKSIKAQEKSIESVDYKGIRSDLDKNTISFYEAYR